MLLGVAFIGASYMQGAADRDLKRIRFISVLFVLLLPLIFFKYTNFFVSLIIAPFSSNVVSIVNYPLPLGLSFITFTLIAYVADVYKGHFPIENSLQRIGAYVLFFPHSIAGPILRPHEFIPQLKRKFRALDAKFAVGTAIFSVGLFKKVVFADQLSPVVDAVYSGPDGLTSLHYLLSIYGFSLQIYCDFSGYTDMAIGLAMILGIHFPNNFYKPYLSSSVAEFWHRWHITLSRWIRDYLYIPLGGNRFGLYKQIRNLFITMSIAGLWHGANITFVLWGVIHAFGISISYLSSKINFIRKITDWPSKWLLTLITFNFVTFAWIFFRARNIDTAFRIISGPFAAPIGDISLFLERNMFVILLLLFFAFIHRFDDHARVRFFIKKAPKPLVWISVGLLWVLTISIGTGSSGQFIYFDF